MNTMRSTSMTSTSGVTFISAMGAASNSPSCLRNAKAIALLLPRKLPRQFDFEYADEGGQPFAVTSDIGADAIVEHHGGNSGDEAKGCCEQSFGNTRRNHAETRIVGSGNALERCHDTPDSPEETDEGTNRADRRKAWQVALQPVERAAARQLRNSVDALLQAVLLRFGMDEI